MGGRAAAGPGPAQGRRRQQRDRGAAGAAGAARPRRPDRHRRRDALAKSHRPHHPGTRRRLLSGAEGQSPALFEDVRLWLDNPATAHAETVDGNHVRIETRCARVVDDVAWLAERHDFPGLAAVTKVTASREIDGKSTTANRYYLLSMPLDATRLAEVVRTHRHIENRLHWPAFDRPSTTVGLVSSYEFSSDISLRVADGVFASWTRRRWRFDPVLVRRPVARGGGAVRIRSGGGVRPADRRSDLPPGGRLAQDGEISVGEHGECDVPVPTDSAAHFVLIQTDVTFGGLEAGFDGPASAGDLHQIGKRRRCWGMDQIKIEVGPIGDGAADQETLPPAIGGRFFLPVSRPNRRGGGL